MSESAEEIHRRYVAEKLDKILRQVELTNGRMAAAEHEIIRLQERTNPWAASGVASGALVTAYAIWEKLSK